MKQSSKQFLRSSLTWLWTSYEIVVFENEMPKFKPCVLHTIEHEVRLIEVMVRGAILLNMQEDSIPFSNPIQKHVFANGADRGGNDLMDMVGYVNRKK
jgi:hypothetical protein